MFKDGSTGQMVKLIQWTLGLTPADGIFGKKTTQAVKEFQHANGLTPDGIVGMKTLSTMGLSVIEDGFKGVQIQLTASKIKDADMNDIPKLVEAIIPMFKNNNHVREHLQKGLELGLKYSEEFHLDTPESLAHFFGQIREEVGTRFTTSENLNYSCTALRSLFGYYKTNPEKANAHGRCDGHKADQQAIANHAYAGRIGNGDAASGDGWKYKGRGCKQLTGRANYQEFQDFMDERFPDITKDFMNQPELLEQPGYALLSGAIFWVKNKIYEKAEIGINKDASHKVTKIINRHTASYNNRWKHTQQAAQLLGIA